MDTLQKIHFQLKKHRYDEHHIITPLRYVTEEIDQIITKLKQERAQNVIDFGSGNGRLTIPLLRAGFHVTAVDISSESLVQLQSIADRLGLATGLKTTTRLPTKGTFDAVVGADVLHHVTIASTFCSLRKMLKKRGVLIFSEPNILNGAWSIFITLFLDWRVERGIIFCNYFMLRDALRKNDFHHITILGHGLLPPPLFNVLPVLQNINYFLGNLSIVRVFAYRLIISAQI